MKAELAGKIKFGVWGVVCGAIAAMVIGFSWGGWATAGTTQKMVESALLTIQKNICVAQYMKDATGEDKLNVYRDTDSYKRSDYIEKGGWDKMPGQAEASYGVSSACAEALDALIKK